MDVPFKSKLAYAWARVTGKDCLYGRVFLGTERQSVFGETGSGMFNIERLRWLEAKPAPDAPGLFTLKECSYLDGISGTKSHDRPPEYREDPVDGAPEAQVFTREKALRLIAEKEAGWALRERPLSRQPFAKLSAAAAR